MWLKMFWDFTGDIFSQMKVQNEHTDPNLDSYGISITASGSVNSDE